MVKSLNELSQQRHQGLYQAFDRVLKLALKELEAKAVTQDGPFVLSLSAIKKQMGWAADARPGQANPAAMYLWSPDSGGNWQWRCGATRSPALWMATPTSSTTLIALPRAWWACGPRQIP